MRFTRSVVGVPLVPFFLTWTTDMEHADIVNALQFKVDTIQMPAVLYVLWMARRAQRRQEVMEMVTRPLFNSLSSSFESSLLIH